MDKQTRIRIAESLRYSEPMIQPRDTIETGYIVEPQPNYIQNLVFQLKQRQQNIEKQQRAEQINEQAKKSRYLKNYLKGVKMSYPSNLLEDEKKFWIDDVKSESEEEKQPEDIWITDYDEEDNTPYYYNKIIKKSQWKKPEELKPKYRIFRDKDGRVYYFNVKTKRGSYKEPRDLDTEWITDWNQPQRYYWNMYNPSERVDEFPEDLRMYRGRGF